MILLKNTTSTLKLVTESATPISVAVVYEIIAGGSTPTHGGVDVQLTNISTATTTTILSAPTAGLRYEVRSIMIHNTHATTSNNVVVNQDENGTVYEHFDCVIGGDEKLQFHRDGGWTRLNKRGVVITEVIEPTVPLKTHIIPFQKNSIGTSEAAGIFHFMGTGSGLLPAWAIGTSGLSGRAVVNTEVGFIKLPSTSNKLVLEYNGTNSNFALTSFLTDVLFVNNGLVVTTTTAQTINSVTLPNRDRNRSNNGVDCLWGLLVTTATTNASPVTTITASYTNNADVASRTATIGSFPATATVGTFIPFTPQAGDYAIKSIQSITLGTTLTAGAVSLVCMRLVDSVSQLALSVAAITPTKAFVYGDECMTVMVMAVGANAYTINPSVLRINEYA